MGNASPNPFDQFDAPPSGYRLDGQSAADTPDVQERARRYMNRHSKWYRDPTEPPQFYWTKPPRRGILDRFKDAFWDQVEHYSPVAMATRALARVTPTSDDYGNQMRGRSREEIAAARAARVTQKEQEWRLQREARERADPAWRQPDRYGHLDD